MPDFAAGTGIERVAFVRARHIEDAFDDDRSALERGGINERKDPFGGKFRDVVLVDLIQGGVAIAADVAVISRPVGLARDFSICGACFAKQMNALVTIGEHLHLVRALIQHHAGKRFAACDGNGGPDEGRAIGGRFKRLEKLHQCLGLRI